MLAFGWRDKAQLQTRKAFSTSLTGNGDFDGVNQWGESFLKLKYTPPSRGVAGRLRSSTTGRRGQTSPEPGRLATPAVKLAGVSAPSEAIKPVGGGMSMSLKNAKLVPMISDRGTPTAPRLSGYGLRQLVR